MKRPSGDEKRAETSGVRRPVPGDRKNASVGDLTGIRPTKIPMKLLEEGWKNTQIAQYMRETYGVSNEKTALAITIATGRRRCCRIWTMKTVTVSM